MTEVRQPATDEPVVAATLTERLTCAACGYDLRGLSVLDRCPECGLRIATSILAVVDPRAQEFEPIRKPKLVAFGLLTWSGGGCSLPRARGRCAPRSYPPLATTRT